MRTAVRRLRAARRQEFSIAVHRGETPWGVRPLAGADGPVLTRRHVTDVPATAVADPFALQRDGAWFMWFEVWRADLERGEIGLATSRDGLGWTYRGIVLAEPFHLSYPYVFTWAGSTYMIPETGSVGAVRLYRAASFPTRWVFERELLVGAKFVDSSVFEHEGGWWMLTQASPMDSEAASGRARGGLRLFAAPEPHGPWREHPRSPVVADDPRVSRPAGRVISVGGRPVRFAQDGSGLYGRAVRAFEIVELTSAGYRERLLTRVPFLTRGPQDWCRGGKHHIDAHRVDGGWLAFVDGWTWRPPEAAGEGS